MAKRVSVDRWLFTVTMLLVFVGLVMVFSASAVMARERFGSPYAFLSKQLVWAVGGAGRHGRRHAGGLPALQASRARVFAAGSDHAAADLGVFSRPLAQHASLDSRVGAFSFQPSELAKPVLILFLAYFLESRTKAMDDVRNTLLPAAAPVLVLLG